MTLIVWGVSEIGRVYFGFATVSALYSFACVPWTLISGSESCA
jgi:hypothetical protein